MKKKVSTDRDPLASCSFCEFARMLDDEPTFCEKRGLPIATRSSCPAYIYDLTKRRPLRLRSSCHLSDALTYDDL